MPKLSIIIVLHNNDNIIQKTLSSIQSQTFKDYEVIVIDDNSSDYGANRIYSNFCKNDHRFKMIVGGNYRNRFIDAANLALSRAEGDLITFVIPGFIYSFDTILNALIETYYMKKNILYDMISFNMYCTLLNEKYMTIEEKNTDYAKYATAEFNPFTEEIEKFNNDNSLILADYDKHIWNEYTSIIDRNFLIDNNIKFRSVDFPFFVFFADCWSKGAKMKRYKYVAGTFIQTCNNIPNTNMTEKAQKILKEIKENGRA